MSVAEAPPRAVRLPGAGWGDRLLVLVAGLALWQALALAIRVTAFPTPVATLSAALRLLLDPSFWSDVAATGVPFLIAVALGVTFGILIGAVMGVSQLTGAVLEPVVVGLYSVPKVVFYPIILMLTGIGKTSEVVFALLHGILPVILFTMAAVRTIRPVFLRTARVMRLGPWRTFRHVVVPAAFPEIFSGIRIGISVSLLGTLLCEMFGSKNGLGFRLVSSMGGGRSDEVMAIALLMIGFATLMNILLVALDRRIRRG